MLILTRSEIQALLDMTDVIEAVDLAHRALALDTGRDLGPASLGVPGSSAMLMPMGSALPGHAGGVKLLADVPDNAVRCLPTQQSTILLVDTENGRAQALLDGGAITACRTAAASAVATRALARGDAHVVGFVGAGRLARAHLDALTRVRPIDRVHLWSRSSGTAESFRDYALDHGFDVKIAASPEEVVRAADIVCTLTPSRDPIVEGAWFTPGIHLNAVGAPPRSDHREIDTEGIRRSRVVVDVLAVAAAKSGDVIIPLAEGSITADHFSDELGQVLTGQRPGRTSADQVTLFNSVGVGTQDIATAALVVQAARAAGMGTELALDH